MNYRTRYHSQYYFQPGYFYWLIIFLLIMNLIRAIYLGISHSVDVSYVTILTKWGIPSNSWLIMKPFLAFNSFLILFALLMRLIVNLSSTIVPTLKIRLNVAQIFKKSDISKFNLIDHEFNEYVDKYGYVKVFVPKYKHRMIAEKILNRSLETNEVVHHIDGVKTNNDPANLCVMDKTKHEQFHAWMNWKKEKEGGYPDIPQLRYELEGSAYKGILLNKFTHLMRALD